MSEWQPIATAPKDGTSVLLYAEAWEMTWGEVQMGSFANGEWHTVEGSVEENEPDFDPAAEVDFETFDDSKNGGPTHWMPLPAPPERVDA